jgi:TRAP-type mannitol/chloroaromatic compound transport system permease large subunit
MTPEFLTIAMFVTLVCAILLGHPLAYTLAAIATLFGLIDNGFDISGLFNMFANNVWGVMNNYTLIAIPLFIFMAQLLDRSKVAEKLFETLYIVLGTIKGGLGLAVVVFVLFLRQQQGLSARP